MDLLDRNAVKLDLPLNGSWNEQPRRPRRRRERRADSAVHRRLRRHADLQDRPAARRVLRSQITSVNDANNDGMIACPDGPGSAGCEFTIADSASFPGTPFPTVELNIIAVALARKFARITATFDHRGGQKIYNLTGVYRNAIFLNGAPVQPPNSSNLASRRPRRRRRRAHRRLHRGRVVHEAARSRAVAHAAAALRGADARRVGHAHDRRAQPAHLDELHRARSRAQRRRAGELHHRRLPHAAAGALLHRAPRARLLRIIQSYDNFNASFQIRRTRARGRRARGRGEPGRLQPGQAARRADAGRRAAADISGPAALPAPSPRRSATSRSPTPAATAQGSTTTKGSRR